MSSATVNKPGSGATSKPSATSGSGIKFTKISKTKPVKSVNKRGLPLKIYSIKDMLKDLVSYKNFADSLAVTFALASIAIALHSIPLPILAILLVATFAIAMVHPLLGLMFLLFEMLVLIMYQAPVLAWLFTILLSASLFLGYKYYRTLSFTYLLATLPFSFLGYFLEIPALVIATLVIGLKRSVLAVLIAISIIVVASGLTGIQNTGSIAYNQSAYFSSISNSSIIKYLAISKPLPTLSTFGSNMSTSFHEFFGYAATEYIFPGLGDAVSALAAGGYLVLIQLVAWLFIVFAINNFVIKSRAKFKGTEASLFGIAIPVIYILLSYAFKLPFNIYSLMSAFVTPLIVLALEYYDIPITQGLNVMKQDFRGKFGEAFEDLSSGTRETLDDVANYEETKRELKESILAPIEHRELAGAYGITPPKGILLFGPPGTGKTLMMRALANEIRAGFFYVKTSSILSPYPGESSQTISRIFATAKKHSPAILFFDEIDSIAGSRELQESDTGRQTLSTLLSEMDGFQKIENVVIIGATNVPQLLDPSIMRPGRFDKIIYMELPDAKGRAQIFKYYLEKLPIGDDMDYKKLGDLTSRYSGADIKNVCEEVARIVADEAAKENKVLKISMADVVNVIKSTKPSTSLSQLEEYNTFKIDYERRTHPEIVQENEERVTLDEVVGLDEAKKALYEAVEIPILHPDLVKKYDVRNIKGILLFGPPGTGKTMLMNAIADEIGDVHMLTVSGADLSRLGIERANLNIKQIFDRAKENTPSILFIDEIDAIAPAREGASETGVQVTSTILEELDKIKSGVEVVFVAATNRPSSLDPALLRAGRFDKLIFVPPPSKEDRAKIFELNLKKAPLADDISFDNLAAMTQGYTGADIANICRQIKMEALERSLSSSSEEKITNDDIIKVIKSVKPSAPSQVIGLYLEFLERYGKR